MAGLADRGSRRTRAAVAGVRAAGPVPSCGDRGHRRGPPVYIGKAFVFEADIDRGVELGWCRRDTPWQELLDAVERTLADRLRRSAKFVEAAVRQEEEDRFTVTFVGRQSRGFEDLVARGLAAAGRFAYRVGTTERELPNVKWRDSPSAIE